MKPKYIPTLLAATAALGLSWGMVLQGNARFPGTTAKDAARARIPEAKSKTHPAFGAEKAPLARLTGISIRKSGGGSSTTVDISTSRTGAYRVLRLEKPKRLVLDLEGTRDTTHRWEYSSDSPLLARVRVGRFSSQHGGIIRVVADLRGNPVCHVERQPPGFRVLLKPRKARGSSGNRRPAASGTESSKPVTDGKPTVIRKVTDAGASAPVTDAYKKPVSHQASTVAPGLTVATPPLSDMPSAGDAASRILKPKRPAKAESQEVVQVAKAAKPVGSAEKAALSRIMAPVAHKRKLEDGPKYTGKRISLDLKGVDLKDFFRLIHEVSGLNIIVDPDVSGTVTMVLDDVPWDQALALVLNDNGLADRLEGNVLRIAKITTLTREREEKQKLTIAKEESAPLVTVFRPLSYAKASTVAALLKTWAGGGALSRRGSVLVDDRTNTLIISDIASRMPRIETVINKLDQKAQQVSIQARIIRASSDFARNLSTALSFAQRNGSGSLVTGGATGNPVSGEPLSPPPVTTSPATGFGVFVLSNLGRNYAINAAIAAAETHDQAKTISQPSIVTQNNVEGTVIQGTQIPIQTTINNTISVQYVQASLELKVTPQVTQDGNVFLTIDVQNSSPGPALTFAGPTINTQSATTQVLVPNGGTVIFGGVTVHTRSNSSTGLPWLGSIPILGHLFKSTSNTRNDQELLFFVTPKILKT